MGIRKYKPTSAGRRFMTSADYDEITQKSPHKPLLVKSHNKKENKQSCWDYKSRGLGTRKQSCRICQIKFYL